MWYNAVKSGSPDTKIISALDIITSERREESIVNTSKRTPGFERLESLKSSAGERLSGSDFMVLKKTAAVGLLAYISNPMPSGPKSIW